MLPCLLVRVLTVCCSLILSDGLISKLFSSEIFFFSIVLVNLSERKQKLFYRNIEFDVIDYLKLKILGKFYYILLNEYIYAIN